MDSVWIHWQQNYRNQIEIGMKLQALRVSHATLFLVRQSIELYNVIKDSAST